MKLTVKVRDVLESCRHQEALWRVRVAMKRAMNVKDGVDGFREIEDGTLLLCLGTRQAFPGWVANLQRLDESHEALLNASYIVTTIH